MRVPKLTSLVFAVYLAAPTGPASADPCVGPAPFLDIAQADSFCSDAEWLKNRGVSNGIGGGLYGPNNFVLRSQMALFMQRLGTALSPQTIIVDEAPGAIDLDAAPQILPCTTGQHAVTGYPRKAIINSTFAGQAAGALEYQHEIYFSTNNGATWTFTNGNINRNGTAGAHWVSSNTNYIQDLDVGTTYRWGVRLARISGTADFGTSRCFINVEILNRTGTSSPFDANRIDSADN